MRFRRVCAEQWFCTLAAVLCVSGAFAQGKSAETGGPSGPEAGASRQAAGRAISITVPEAGEHFVRVLPSADAKQPAQLPVRFLDKKFTVNIDPAVIGKSPRVAVDDAATGNSAIVPVPPTGVIELHRSDFDTVHRVEVSVTYEGKPVQVARVTMTPDGGRAVTRQIDSAARGMTVFEDVPAGKAKLTLVYGDNLSTTQDVVVSTDHTGDKLAISAPVTNKVPTIDVPNAAAAGPGSSGDKGNPSEPSGDRAPASQQSSGGFGGFVGQLLGLALILGALYALFRWAQSGGMAATLKKVGVEVSGPPPPSDAGTPWQPNAPAAPVVQDPSLCQFCGQRKDASGNCLCEVSPGGAVGAAAGAPSASQPRLVGAMGVYSGSIFPVSVAGAPMTFGRDAANSVSLANDTTVSRRHASIRSEGDQYIVADEGSSNGIYVNGVRVGSPQALRPGDELQIGNTRFRFEL